MEPKNSIVTTVNKANGVLDFIKRWAKKFSNPYVTKQLKASFVRNTHRLSLFNECVWTFFVFNLIEYMTD